MIIKTEVTGKCLAALVSYAHSDESIMKTSDNIPHRIVRVKALNPQTNEKYTVTLEVTEWVFMKKSEGRDAGMYHVSPNFLLAINQILEDQFDDLNPSLV